MQKKQKKAGVAILRADKIHFRTDWHYIMTKRSIQQEDISFVDIYAPNTRVPKSIKQILTD